MSERTYPQSDVAIAQAVETHGQPAAEFVPDGTHADAIAAVATLSRRELDRVVEQTGLRAFTADLHRNSPSLGRRAETAEEIEPDVQAAARLWETRDTLGHPKRTVLATTIAGFVMGSTAILGGFMATSTEGDPLQHDGSILPGAKGGVVPGMPDIPGGTVNYEVEGRKVTVTTTLRQDATESTARNSLARNGKLTGEEKEQDLVVAGKLIKGIHAVGGKITSVHSEGLASDDARLGRADDDINGRAATQRGKVGLEAFKEAATGQQMSLARVAMSAGGHEVVLQGNNLKILHEAAITLGYPTPEAAIKAFDTRRQAFEKEKTGKGSKATAVENIDKLIAGNRGTQYKVDFELPEKTYSSTPIREKIWKRFKAIATEPIVWLGGFAGALYAGTFVGPRLINPRAKYRARKIMRQSGIQL